MANSECGLSAIASVPRAADKALDPESWRSLPGPCITITYCTQCQWLLRAAWMAQELLSTFRDDLQEVALRPGTGGVFVIELESEVIWERVRDGGFPDVKVLKQRVRDRIDPGRDLGHVDRAGQES